MITGLNHITLAVSDVEKSLQFYTTLLGFKGIVAWREGAYLTLGDLWLCLSKDEPSAKRDYSHIAFSVSSDDFAQFKSMVEQENITQWKTNTSEGDSVYFLDLDGNKLEAHHGDLNSRLLALKTQAYDGLRWL